MPWRRPTYRITFDILAASQELNYYGSAFVMWVVHRKVNNEKLLFAIARKGTYSFVGVRSKLSSKIHRWRWLSLLEQFLTQPVKIYSSDKTEKRKEPNLWLLKNL